MYSKKIKLAIVFYGNTNQTNANLRQFKDLKRNLHNFEVKKYNFNTAGQLKLLTDFKHNKVDVVLKNSYGRGNESHIESFFDTHKIPYLGSDASATFIGTNKFLSKNIFLANNLPTPNYVYINRKLWGNQKLLLKKINSLIKYPCVIKDAAGTDSRGLKLAKNEDVAKKTIDKFLKTAEGLIVEEYIKKDHEVTCLVSEGLNTHWFPVEVQVKNFFGPKAKDSAKTVYKNLGHLPLKVQKRVSNLAKAAHRVLGCKMFSRSDILIKDNKLYLLEVDVHPGFSSASASTAALKFMNKDLNTLFLNYYSKLKKYGKKTKNS